MIDSSREIIEKAMADFQPYAVVAMVSGGRDSLCAYKVARAIGVPLTHMLHGVTGTGIPETTEFVRQFAASEGLIYIEANAKDAYEKYVNRKGFFGLGNSAHSYAYHLLKHQPFQHCISRNIRFRKRNRPVLLINGARASESTNRGKHMKEPITRDPGNPSNIWVNILHHWSREERDTFLDSTNAPINPVTTNLCRSGECMCGTMQSIAARVEASFYYPKWGEWLDNLERPIAARFGWGWGQTMPPGMKAAKTAIPDSFAPMCIDCLADSGESET